LLRKAQSNRAFDEGPTYANRSKPTLTAFILDGEHGNNCQRVNMVRSRRMSAVGWILLQKSKIEQP
jgi:hypothetical protein